ncbi:CheR family methyltransferase [Fodinibius sp.]|uniref:CheR family methyltransferase n=1 Tax=Fodinibius sp. TaxID=1872440 RepID=UPI0035658EB7
MVLHSEDERKNEDPLVVGLGASAGGLEALSAFFEAMPDSPGMAFVVIIHLSPDHESSVARLLQEHTSMTVLQVTGRTPIKADHVYVIPPGSLLTLQDRYLVLADSEKNNKQLTTIDLFFRSLGKAKGHYSACVILSGTGSDGSIGLKTVKEYGGIVITQESGEAGYDGMPRSAVQTGLVDLVLPLKEIPAHLVNYKESLKQINIPDSGELPENETHVLRDILSKLNEKTGHDFTRYKQSSVLRRLERRMRVHRIRTLPAYLEYISQHPPEIRALFKDLLISVTNFFRDREAFQELQETVIPKLFEDKSSKDSLRVWIPGCATGEEAYSLALLLHEHAQSLDSPPAIQLFATDIDEEALDTARKGRYPQSVATDITSERLEQHFLKEGTMYRVKPTIRSMILFADHDLLKDPPFSKLDMISCRNLLIYLDRELQSEVFNLFHYALKPEQWLFLGMSDSILKATELFDTVNSRYQIYRQSTVSKSRIRLPRYPLSTEGLHSTSPRAKKGEPGQQLSIEDLHHRLLFKQYEPASVIVNANQEVLHATSDIDRFLKYSGGEPSQNILKMVVPELRKVLSRLLFQIKQDDNTLSSKKVRFNGNDASRFCKVVVRKIVEPKAPEGLIHIVFMEVPASVHEYPRAFETVDEESDVVAALEKELEYTREQLHITIEEYETSNEELHASNEELQSMNEELRSTTEQLETSKEELQSVNEELKSVNAELEHKIEKLDEANSNFKNLMEATEIATIFVDRDNHVQFYTEAATDLFNLIPADVGRLFRHITHQLNYKSVLKDIDQSKDSLETIKKIVSDEDDRQYIMRIRPYRTVANKMDGVVLTFVNITQLKKVEEQLTKEVERGNRLQREILSNSLSERWELGAYLHDNLAQILVSIKILVNEVKAQLSAADNRGETSSILTDINNLIDIQIENIRNVSHDIIPIDVEEEGVSHAFHLLMRRSQEIHEINCTLNTNGILSQITNRELSTHLYHITQEAIKNASVHGEADRILVTINEVEERLCLEVNDNGIGFSSAEKDSEGMGLRIMKHRVELMGGVFTVSMLPDSETFTTGIRCTFPIESVRQPPEERESPANE